MDVIEQLKLKCKVIFICIVIGIFLGIIILELFLHLCGFGYNIIYSLPKDKGADYKIFCVGESTTWGIGASNEILKSYPRQLEEMLSKKFPNLKIQCFYDQTIGQNTSEILRKLPLYIQKYQPDLIIFMVGVNNWWNLDRSNILLFNKNKKISSLTLQVLVFLDKFRVWKLIKWLGYSAGLKRERWNYFWPKGLDVHKYTELTYHQYGWDIFAQVAYYDLREMIKICKNNKIKIIMSTYPKCGFSGLSQIQKKIAEEFNLPLVDNCMVFSKFSNVDEYFSSDRRHLNDKGYRLIAEKYLNCIISNNLIQ